MEQRILEGMSAADIEELFRELTDEEVDELGRRSYVRFHFPDEATSPKRPRLEEGESSNRVIFSAKKVRLDTNKLC
jgi:hypothetical protein